MGRLAFSSASSLLKGALEITEFVNADSSGTRQYGILFIIDMVIKEKHRDKITEVFSDPDKITQALVQLMHIIQSYEL